LALLATTGIAGLMAQGHEAHQSSDDRPYWRLAVIVGHTFIPAEHSGEYTAVPSWGLDLEYWFRPRWAVALHNDLEIESYVVRGENGEDIHRQFPLVLTLDLLWMPVGGLILMAGPGWELEANENLQLIRFGAEYEFHLPGHWDISPTIFYDSRHDAYDTWSVGLGVGKRF
ncbi:MAG: hypothetical protein KDC54_12900, partial [Lewinella sp.]|nr:hypothetical protein [Lewinella sp.]